MDKNNAKAKGKTQSLSGSNGQQTKDYGTILMNFMRQFPASDDKPFTHTSIAKGSYHIPDEHIPKVYKLLGKAIKNGNEVHLTEKPTNPSQLKIDLDFRFELDVPDRLYTLNHIYDIVKLYNNAIKLYVDIPENVIQAFVFQRDAPYKFKGNTKDGIHIMYPNVVIDTNIQFLIRDYVLDNCHNIFANLPLKNSYDDVVDKAVIAKNNWLMYGCTKPNCKPYKLTHILNYDLSKDNLNKTAYTTDNLIIYLSNLHKD